MKHALRQTVNLPNQSLFAVPAVYLTTKLTIAPILFVLPVDLSKLSLLCLNLEKLLTVFLRACHGPFVWAGPGRANPKTVTDRAEPGRDF